MAGGALQPFRGGGRHFTERFPWRYGPEKEIQLPGQDAGSICFWQAAIEGHGFLRGCPVRAEADRKEYVYLYVRSRVQTLKMAVIQQHKTWSRTAPVFGEPGSSDPGVALLARYTALCGEGRGAAAPAGLQGLQGLQELQAFSTKLNNLRTDFGTASAHARLCSDDEKNRWDDLGGKIERAVDATQPRVRAVRNDAAHSQREAAEHGSCAAEVQKRRERAARLGTTFLAACRAAGVDVFLATHAHSMARRGQPKVTVTIEGDTDGSVLPESWSHAFWTEMFKDCVSNGIFKEQEDVQAALRRNILPRGHAPAHAAPGAESVAGTGAGPERAAPPASVPAAPAESTPRRRCQATREPSNASSPAPRGPPGFATGEEYSVSPAADRTA